MGSRILSVLKQIWRDRECYLFLAPFGIIFTVFTVVPVVMSIFLSFTYFNMLQPARWVGIHNYVRLFLEDDVFLIAVRNTLLYASITGPLSYLLCFILAWFINDLKPRSGQCLPSCSTRLRSQEMPSWYGLSYSAVTRTGC